jgi:hypothetical protein
MAPARALKQTKQLFKNAEQAIVAEEAMKMDARVRADMQLRDR